MDNFTVLKNMNIKLKEQKLFNLTLIHMDIINKTDVFVLSKFGDLIRIKDINQMATFQKYYQIFKLGPNYDYCQINIDHSALFAGNFGYLIDRYEK